MARWMVAGGVFSEGTRRPSSASTSSCCRPRYSRRSMSGFFWTEGLGNGLTVLADEHFDARLRFFQLLAADVAETHAALEELERAVKREIAAFELLDHLFQLVHGRFERYRGLRTGLVFRHWSHSSNRWDRPP